MLDLIEKWLARWIGQLRFWMIMRSHPQLEQLDDQKDRDWALWYATADASIWHRLGQVAVVLIVGPSIVIALTLMVLELLRWRLGGVWPLILLGLWLAGLILTAVIIEARLGRGAGRSCFRAMRLFGYDICAECGYDMKGHQDEVDTPRTCPECGSAVAPHDRPGRSVDGGSALTQDSH